MERGSNSLDESIATTASVIVLLELNKLKLSKWLKYSLKILLCDIEMNVAYIKAVEGYRVRMSTRRVWVASLAILLSLGMLHNDRDT